ncbi:flagellar hook-basal body complex protein [Geovibrio thiophilus]|nr:flagellar hook basal-body protein [Geovibrio thiophilus]
MIQSLYSSSSALLAYSKAQDSTAHNIANVNTPAFQSFSQTFSELANQGGVKLNSVRTDEGTGYLIPTGNSLDFSINGNGYFKVTDAEGNESYTRRGDFSVDAAGDLVTKDGGIVAAGVADGGRLEIADNGEIFSDGAYKGRIEVVDKNGNPMPEDSYGIEQGTLEASDTDIAKEIVDSMVYLSSYKANIVTTQTADQMLGTIIDMMA